MKWSCKLCNMVVPKKGDLMKHYRLRHDYMGRQLQPCLYSDCPCSFKTLNSLRSHLSRHHAPEIRPPGQITSFKCPNCHCSMFASANDFLKHLRFHLKRHETVTCVFKDCNFKTNVYGTFAAHKSRKHTPHLLTDFKSIFLEQNVIQYHSNSSPFTEDENEDCLNVSLLEEKDS